MKAAILSAVIALSFIVEAKESPDELADSATKHAKELRGLLDSERWDVSVKGASVHVQSKFEMEVFPIMGAPLVPENYEWPKEPYSFEIRFAERIAKEDYHRIAKIRAEAITTVNFGAKSKSDWGDAETALLEKRLPRHGSERGFSVYITTSENLASTYTPLELLREARVAVCLAESCFRRYEP